MGARHIKHTPFLVFVFSRKDQQSELSPPGLNFVYFPILDYFLKKSIKTLLGI